MSDQDEPKGLAGGLTNYGDPDFARYLRMSFARSMGLSSDLLKKPVKIGHEVPEVVNKVTGIGQLNLF